MENQETGLKKFNFPVEGMTCASCVTRVEKAISKVEGIKSVSVNFATEKVSFEFDTKQADLNKVVKAVEDAGYKLTIANASVSKEQKSGNLLEIDDAYYLTLKKDFIISLVFSFPVFLISMLMEFSWFHSVFPISMDYTNKILLVLTTPVIFIPGKRFFTIFANNIKHLTADMNSLVAIGTGAAYGYSLLATLFPEIISQTGKVPHVYFDSASVIITLILLGRFLENRAKQRTNSTIQKLMELEPTEALVKRNGNEIKINLKEIVLGDIVIVKPGEKIPADGIIISGFSTVDESMITGESIPIEKGKGSKVLGGTINKNGSLEFEVTAIGDNSILGQIIKLVEEAQGSKAPIQKLADKVAAIFVPAVVVIALITFVTWFLIGDPFSFSHALINFVAVLIIACPCALGLATPTAIIVGTGLGANHGILIKNGESLEVSHKISTILLDKTGTITEGKPSVTDIITKDLSEDELVSYAASAENKSEHPIAHAISEYGRLKSVKLKNVDSFQSFTGLGITALVDDEPVLIGTEGLMREYSINTQKFQKEFAEFNYQGKTTIYVAVGGEVKGLIAIEDPIRKSSKDAITQLKEMKIKVVMLTGDNLKTAEAIANRVGIEDLYAQILPEDKSRLVKSYQEKNEIVAMVGDGINDSPALASSNIGIAMGSGTDVAIETSDITLLHSDLKNLVNVIKLSQRTIKTIKQNLFWAFFYNIIGIPLAALGLLNPMFAALAMSFSSVSVVSNSLRLKRFKF